MFSILFAVTLAHTFLALQVFQPFSDFLKLSGLHALDFGVLEHQIGTARAAFDASGRLWGYDPRFLAGYVETYLWNSNVVLQIVGLMFRPLSAGQIVKCATVVTAALLPGLFYLSWRFFGANRKASLGGALLGVVWFHATEVFAFWASGMTTGYFVFPLSLLGIAVLSTLIRGENRGAWIIAVAPVSLLVHKSAVVTLGIPALVIVLINIRTFGRRQAFILATAMLATVAVNAFWLGPLWKNLNYSAFADVGAHWINKDPWALFRDLISASSPWGKFDRPGWLSAVLFKDFALLSLCLALNRPSRDHMTPRGYLVAAVCLSALVYFGSFLSALRPLDPSRYIPYASLLVAVPGTAVLIETVRTSRFWATVAAVIVASLVLTPSPVSTFLRNPVSASESDEILRVAEWIEALPGEGRIHVETFSPFEESQPPWREDFAFFPLVLPLRIHRQLLGGFYPGFYSLYNHTNYFSGLWQNRPLREWRGEELRQNFKNYHVEYLLTWTDGSGEALSRLPDIVEEIGAPRMFRGWRVKDPGTWFVSGSGRQVDAEFDHLEFVDVKNEEGLATLSYHWAPTLVSQGAVIEPVQIGDDPVPFIGLRDPQNTVVITNGGKL